MKKYFLSSLFQSLNNQNVDYFVFGSYKDLPYDTGGSDIDLVVNYHDMDKVQMILNGLILEYPVKLVSYYTNSNTKFYRLLSPKWGVQIDVFYKGLCYKSVEYYPVDLIKKHIIEYNGIKVIDEKYGFYVDFFKEIIHIGHSKEKYRAAFVSLVDNDRIKIEHEIKTLFGEEVMQLVYDNLSIEGLNRISKELQNYIRKKILKGRLWQVLIVNCKLINRLFCKAPGYVIVVEGTDGSGKSTVIDAITSILNEAFHNGVVYNHLRPNTIPDLGVILGKKRKENAHVVNTNPHNQKASGVFGSMVRWGYYMIDYTFGYLIKMWLQIHMKSKVFIFDRYYYDYYIDQKRSCTSLPRWIIRMGELFVPKPDLVLCLGGDPKLIFERKPETSIEEVTRQTDELQQFCKSRNNTVWINTTQPLDKSVTDAMNAIVDMMSFRFAKTILK